MCQRSSADRLCPEACSDVAMNSKNAGAGPAGDDWPGRASGSRSCLFGIAQNLVRGPFVKPAGCGRARGRPNDVERAAHPVVSVIIRLKVAMSAARSRRASTEP